MHSPEAGEESKNGVWKKTILTNLCNSALILSMQRTPEGIPQERASKPAHRATRHSRQPQDNKWI